MGDEMALSQSDPVLDGIDWAAALAELENFDWQPSEEDYRAAMRDTVAVFRQGRLTEDELKWVLSLLAAQMATQVVEGELREALLDFGRDFDQEPSFARRPFRWQEEASLSELPYA